MLAKSAEFSAIVSIWFQNKHFRDENYRYRLNFGPRPSFWRRLQYSTRWTDQFRPVFVGIKQKSIRQMYAIIADGGRQYKVEEGQILEIDYREAEPGQELVFDRVLAVSNESGFKLGKPTVEGASVKAKVIGETKGDKIFVQKFRRRKNSKTRTGHRQKYVKVQISGIA